LQDNELSKLGYLLTQFFRNTQRLFHMLVGLVFLVLAAAGATVSLSERERDHTVSVVVASFTVVLIAFGLYSFAKARSIR
jgi:sulfite exporter TauE/SafE